MKTIATIFFVFFFHSVVWAQSFDTILTTSAYTSYFSNSLHEPVLVVYKLYKGGGDCDRNARGFRFINDVHISAAVPSDYAHSGYDQGHLANAEDFAYDCTLDELTFRFYNCVPQTPNLNRGVYKSWEATIRGESQRDSLLIICGNMFGTRTIGHTPIAVPDSCFKVVQSLSTKKVLHALMFSNSKNATVREESIQNLEKEIGYVLPLKQ